MSKSNFVKVIKFSCCVKNCLYVNMAFVIIGRENLNLTSKNRLLNDLRRISNTVGPARLSLLSS